MDLSALLHLGSSFIDVPGGTASWTFNAGSVNKNYNPVTGTADIVIEQATSTAAMTFEDGPYVYRGSAAYGHGERHRRRWVERGASRWSTAASART